MVTATRERHDLEDLVFGAGALRAEVAKAEIKAISLDSRRRAVLERFGEDAAKTVEAALEGEAKRLWTSQIVTTAWLPIAPYLEIDRAILRHLLDDDLDRMVKVVTEIAESELNLVYRFLLKLGSPGFVLKRMGVAFESKVRPGKMRLVEGREGFGVSEISGMVLPPYVCHRTAPAWAERALELSGARDVTTAHTACRHRGDEVCRYETRWR